MKDSFFLILVILLLGCKKQIILEHLVLDSGKRYIFVKNYNHSQENEKIVDDYFCAMASSQEFSTGVQVYRTTKTTNLKRVKDNPKIIGRYSFTNRNCAEDFMWLYTKPGKSGGFKKAIFGNPEGFIDKYFYEELECMVSK